MELIVMIFFLKTFAKGFVIGCMIRLIISMVFKTDMTFGGMMRTAFIIGLLYTAMIFFLVMGI